MLKKAEVVFPPMNYTVKTEPEILAMPEKPF